MGTEKPRGLTGNGKKAGVRSWGEAAAEAAAGDAGLQGEWRPGLCGRPQERTWLHAAYEGAGRASEDRRLQLCAKGQASHARLAHGIHQGTRGATLCRGGLRNEALETFVAGTGASKHAAA